MTFCSFASASFLCDLRGIFVLHNQRLSSKRVFFHWPSANVESIDVSCHLQWDSLIVGLCWNKKKDNDSNSHEKGVGQIIRREKGAKNTNPFSPFNCRAANIKVPEWKKENRSTRADNRNIFQSSQYKNFSSIDKNVGIKKEAEVVYITLRWLLLVFGTDPAWVDSESTRTSQSRVNLNFWPNLLHQST